MKKTVFLKSTLRQFGRSLFLFLLIGVISFAFASRIGESQLISQEMDELTQYYRSVGNLSRTGPDEYGYWGSVPDQVIEYLEQSPYVAYIDQRNYISGVMQDGLYNIDLNAPYTSSIQYGNAPEVNPADIFFYGIYTEGVGEGRYIFTVDTVLSGYPEYRTSDGSVILSVDQEDFGDRHDQLEYGGRYLLRVCRERTVSSVYRDFTWKPLASDLPWFLPAESDIDLSLPEYARFVSEMKQCHNNACSLPITATADMSAIPLFQPTHVDSMDRRYYLADGRWLDYEDHLNGNRVMVINKGLADIRGLAVGDTLTIQLRDLAVLDINGSYYQSYYGYQTELRPIGQEEPENSQTETFEIVGIYEELTQGTDHYQWPVYIPLSVVPEGFTPAAANDDFEICSLVLNSPTDEEAFQDATQQDLADMEYYITFTETNYQSFIDSTAGVAASARNNVIIFAVILAVCFCLAVFVYFRFRRKDIAISRALGVPAGKCMIASALPLILVGGVGIVAGSVLAWIYTQGNAETLLAALVEAAGAEGTAATLPINTLAILDLILIAALLVLALIFATVAVKKPVLSQLQGGRNKR